MALKILAVGIREGQLGPRALVLGFLSFEFILLLGWWGGGSGFRVVGFSGVYLLRVQGASWFMCALRGGGMGGDGECL